MLARRGAIFLDRDGVLTEPVWNPQTREFESPHTIEDVSLCTNILVPLGQLQDEGFKLFIISNQPSYAKGKTSLANLEAIAHQVDAQLGAAGISVRESFYCYHHPEGVVAGYSGPCPCRKPSPFFLFQAAERYAIDLSHSWMIGDRDTDILCGQRAGCRTLLILHPRAGDHQGRSKPEAVAADLAEAVQVIIAETAVMPTPPLG